MFKALLSPLLCRAIKSKVPRGLKYPNQDDYFGSQYFNDKSFNPPSSRKNVVDTLKETLEHTESDTYKKSVPPKSANKKTKERIIGKTTPPATAELESQHRFDYSKKKQTDDLNTEQTNDEKIFRTNCVRGNVALKSNAKESIYRDYMAGMPIKDVCTKYGILADRAKAVIYNRHTYWTMIYPEYGEKHKRMMDMITASMEMKNGITKNKVSYVESNLDLIYKVPQARPALPLIKRSLNDKKLSTEKTTFNNDLRSMFRKYVWNKEYTTIPIRIIGSGPKSYLLRDIIFYKGKGKRDVDKKFKDLAKNRVNDILCSLYPEN